MMEIIKNFLSFLFSSMFFLALGAVDARLLNKTPYDIGFELTFSDATKKGFTVAAHKELKVVFAKSAVAQISVLVKQGAKKLDSFSVSQNTPHVVGCLDTYYFFVTGKIADEGTFSGGSVVVYRDCVARAEPGVLERRMEKIGESKVVEYK